MSQNAGLQILLYGMALLILAPALGEYMARVYQGRPGFVGRVVGPLERAIYRWTGVDPDQEMDWKSYAMAMLLFNAVGMLALYGLQRVQGWLPLNPLRWGPVSPTIAFNTAVSFVTNTDWQAYAGETTMSFLTQMMGLTVQNFLSAATGMAVAVAVIRGFARASAQTLGNFWVDLTRSVLYILLPLSVLLALFLVSQGAVQTLQGSVTVHLIQPVRLPEGRVLPEIQLPLGPVASQTAIQHLGTNGGGFFNTNAAHPFANPTPLTDFMLALALMAIPVAFAYAFGRMIGDVRQGWALLAAMLILLLVPLGVGYLAEASGNPRLAALGVDLRPSPWNPGGQHDRQGGALRDCPFRHLYGFDHGHFHRGGRRDAGCDDTIGRGHGDVADDVGGGRSGRSGQWPLRDAGFRRRRGFRGGADGRPDAGVFGEEDQGV